MKMNKNWRNVTCDRADQRLGACLIEMLVRGKGNTDLGVGLLFQVDRQTGNKANLVSLSSS